MYVTLRMHLLGCLLTALLVDPAMAAHSGGGSVVKANDLLDLRPGEWREPADTKMSAVFPHEDKTTWGVIGPKAVVIAWEGAAYHTKRNAFVFNGGGHSDYGGNEVYAFFVDEMKWHRLTEPGRADENDTGQYVTTDNTPVSAHTYDGLEYLPNVDRVFRKLAEQMAKQQRYRRFKA